MFQVSPTWTTVELSYLLVSSYVQLLHIDGQPLTTPTCQVQFNTSLDDEQMKKKKPEVGRE